LHLKKCGRGSDNDGTRATHGIAKCKKETNLGGNADEFLLELILGCGINLTVKSENKRRIIMGTTTLKEEKVLVVSYTILLLTLAESGDQ
jgi:hypothetical protein